MTIEAASFWTDGLAPVHLIGVGGAVGAVGRYLVGEYVKRESFPVSVLVVNVIGTFLAGLVLFGISGEQIVQFVAVGACGSFTTFSSFSVQTMLLLEDGRHAAAVVHALGNLIACLLAVALAWLAVAVL